MGKKKNILIILIAVILILGAILGFMYLRGGGEEGGGGSSGGKITLVYWGLWEPETHMREVIEEYQEENPNVEIQYSQKRFTQYEDNIYERLTDPQTTPDIVRINNTWTYKFQSRLAPLPPEVMTDSEYQEAFYPAAMEDFLGADGNIYAIPWEIDGLGLYYNKDLFEEAGITTPPGDWDTFIEVAQELTETDSSGEITQAGAAIGCSTNINHSADIMYALMLQNNVQMTSSDAAEATFNTTRGETALTYYTDFVKEHAIWDCGLRNDLEMFSAGKVAMMFGPSWRTFDIINMNSSVNFGTAPLPQLAASDEQVHYGMYWGDAVSAQSQNQLEAWKFVKFLSEKETQQSIYAAASQSRAFGEPYSRPELASELSDAPYVAAFVEMAPYMTSWKMGDQQTAETSINKAISDVIDERDTETNALTTAVETINEKLLEIYGSS